jgi:hypothetical protein
MSRMKVTYRIQSVKRFYFLDYFYILLESIDRYQKLEDIFQSFLSLKQRHSLGESKYKKLTTDTDQISKEKIRRYIYTFNEVLTEALEYKLIRRDTGDDDFHLTTIGEELLANYQEKGKGSRYFNQSLFKFMEKKFGAFHYLIDILYKANKQLPGLLVLPSYSPRKLGFERSNIRTTGDIYDYSVTLTKQLQKDIRDYLGETRKLGTENDKIMSRLIETNLLSIGHNTQFDSSKYNVITKRFRDFWMNYFLKEIYGYAYSMTSFDIWTYRGKQMGIIHATEFHPYFNGKIVYPLSVIMNSVQSKDFTELYTYADESKLYVHQPKWEENKDKFVDSLTNAYFHLRRTSRSYFVNLLSIREIVCLNMKISEKIFEDFLNITYRLNLAGTLKIGISLEVDKLPEETQAMYLTQELVMVDGKYRNIIAVDVSKEG